MRNIFHKRSKGDARQAPSQPQTTPADDIVLVNQNGLLVTPISRPARFATPDPNIEHFQQHFMESLARQGAVSQCVMDDTLTPLPPPSRYSRWVETEFFLSRIEQLIIATDPRARHHRLKRLCKYYTNPIAALFKTNLRRADALQAQMEELEWLWEKTSHLPFPPHRSGSLPSSSTSPSQSVTEIDENEFTRPLPRIAQLANQDVSISDDAVYNRAMNRFLAESPQLSAQERSSMEDLRSSRNRQRLVTSPRLSRIPEGSEITSATRRVSHKTASHYMEQIDVRPEMRDPRMVVVGGFGGRMG